MNPNFKPWSPELRDGEFRNWTAFQEDVDPKKKLPARVIVFDSALDIVECFNKNVKGYGGSGLWGNTSNLQLDKSRSDSWRCGNDYSTINQTAQALSTGSIKEKYLNRVETKKEELFNQFPRLKELSEIGITKRRRRTFTEDGPELDIDRFMCGDPAAFVSLPRMDVRSRIARIYFNFGANADISATIMIDSMITICALCEIISAAGVSTEIWGGGGSFSVNDSTSLVNVCVKAKGADEPMDVARVLTFALPALFRNYTFGAYDNVYDRGEKIGCGCGRSPREMDQVREVASYFDADVVINCGQSMTYGLPVIIKDIEKFFNIDKNNDND